MPKPTSRLWSIAALAAAIAVLGATGGAGAGHADPDAAGLDRQIAQATQQLEVIVERYDAVQVRLAATRHQIDELTARMVSTRQDVAAERRRLATLVTSVYRSTVAGTLELLLRSRSPRDMLDRLTTLEQVARERDRRVAALLALQARYDQQQRTEAALAAQQEALRAELIERRTAIKAKITALTRMRVAASGSAGPQPGARPPDVDDIPPQEPDAASRAVRFARQQVGKPYEWGAAGPDSYDCSGLTLAAWNAAGVALPHNAAMQWDTVAHVPRTALRPGDLVFYHADVHHVALYAGGGRVIHAPGYGERITVAPLDLAEVYGYGRPR